MFLQQIAKSALHAYLLAILWPTTISVYAQTTSETTSETVPTQNVNVPPSTGANRTDTFETKIKLLEAAWKRGDFDVARSLTHSLRDTVVQAQRETQSPGLPLVAAQTFRTIDSLGIAGAEWANGWKYFKVISVEEPAGERRSPEPVELILSFPVDQVAS